MLRFTLAIVSLALPLVSIGSEQPHLVQSLNDKGISEWEVLRHARSYEPVRPVPAVKFWAADELPHQDRTSAVEQREIELSLQGLSQHEHGNPLLSFGLPFPQGELFDLRRITFNQTDQKPFPYQAHALALWPDGSVKSALIQIPAKLVSNTTRSLLVRYGQQIPQTSFPAHGIQIEQTDNHWTIDTGKLKSTISLDHFNFAGPIEIKGQHSAKVATFGALILRDVHGEEFSSAQTSVDEITLERYGHLDALIRVSGKLSNASADKQWMRYIARLRFIANSGQIEISLTLINNSLKNEFVDVRSLSLDIDFTDTPDWQSSIHNGQQWINSHPALSLRQWDDQHLQIANKASNTRASGIVRIQQGKQNLQVAVRDFWQRWPKGIDLAPGKLSIQLLPEQPSSEFGQSLPAHLAFPFVDGHYRSKWGMAFTERMVFNFDAQPISDSEQPSATFNEPARVRIPLDYLNQTKVFGRFPTSDSALVSQWNQYVDQSMDEFLLHREQSRAYGYFNWGDWYGERGRNWGNNEYDIPHGFFRQYLFNGDPRYLDAAIAGARHQADVDIIHAYPDPYFIGANQQHSIGHTGITYHLIPPNWSFRYGEAAHAGNGHTWADGMADCWLLTGDPVVMESLLKLGEHIRFAYTPTAKSLGNHHRSIGWAALAAAATWRATSDPEYLQAMQSLLEIAITQWDRDSGIWPYELAAGHAQGQKGVIGSSIYNLGILLYSLCQYHDLTGDPRVPEILEGASQWLIKTFRDNRAWPYASKTDSTALRRNLTLNLNPLIYPSLGYTAKITGKESIFNITQRSLQSTLQETRKDTHPKEFSIKMHATLETLGLIEETNNNRLPQSTSPAL